MKFAQNFKDALERDEYPKEWVDSAISYKKLKKCIKRVQEELLGLGLDHETLEKLWQQYETGIDDATQQHTGSDNADRKVHYGFLKDGDYKFVPKLTIALDPLDGSPMDAWLSPDTRRRLRKYGRRPSSPASLPVRHHEEGAQHSGEATSSADDSNDSNDSDEAMPSVGTPDLVDAEPIETIEIPLTSDSEFFQLLRRELAELDRLQKAEQKYLEQEIVKLGTALRQVHDLSLKKKKKSREEVEAWREIFRIYIESEVFFSSHEQDAGVRDAAHAEQQLTYFNKTVQSEQQKEHLRLTPQGAAALETFMRINIHLLKLMKYQEINKTALNKILKKFDKRTALHAKDGAMVQLNEAPYMAQNLAKASSFAISEELLNIIPQLDDYLCPICFTISWKPIRLNCQHVFCIRCLIVMQQNDKDNCPLCRERVVLSASSENYDIDLAHFLKNNFRDLVKEKQKANELAAGVELFGPSYTGTHRCVVM